MVAVLEAPHPLITGAARISRLFNDLHRLICPTGKFLRGPVKVAREKYSASVFQKITIIVIASRPGKRGVRVVTNVGRDAMDANAQA